MKIKLKLKRAHKHFHIRQWINSFTSNRRMVNLYNLPTSYTPKRCILNLPISIWSRPSFQRSLFNYTTAVWCSYLSFPKHIPTQKSTLSKRQWLRTCKTLWFVRSSNYIKWKTKHIQNPNKAAGFPSTWFARSSGLETLGWRFFGCICVLHLLAFVSHTTRANYDDDNDHLVTCTSGTKNAVETKPNNHATKLYILWFFLCQSDGSVSISAHFIFVFF